MNLLKEVQEVLHKKVEGHISREERLRIERLEKIVQRLADAIDNIPNKRK